MSPHGPACSKATYTGNERSDIELIGRVGNFAEICACV